jgi:hypothetical protein
MTSIMPFYHFVVSQRKSKRRKEKRKSSRGRGEIFAQSKLNLQFSAVILASLGTCCKQKNHEANQLLFLSRPWCLWLIFAYHGKHIASRQHKMRDINNK